MPYPIEPIVVEDPEPSGPFGAKGIGEPGIVGVAPAIANAVADATGIRLRDLPMTSERMLYALVTRETKGDGVRGCVGESTETSGDSTVGGLRRKVIVNSF